MRCQASELLKRETGKRVGNGVCVTRNMSCAENILVCNRVPDEALCERCDSCGVGASFFNYVYDYEVV